MAEGTHHWEGRRDGVETYGTKDQGPNFSTRARASGFREVKDYNTEVSSETWMFKIPG